VVKERLRQSIGSPAGVGVCDSFPRSIGATLGGERPFRVSGHTVAEGVRHAAFVRSELLGTPQDTHAVSDVLDAHARRREQLRLGNHAAAPFSGCSHRRANDRRGQTPFVAPTSCRLSR
jgi:hypothetical protein